MALFFESFVVFGAEFMFRRTLGNDQWKMCRDRGMPKRGGVS
jgi:hypothetical protein